MGLFNLIQVIKFLHTYQTFLQVLLRIVVQHKMDYRNKRKHMVAMLVKFRYNYHNNQGSSHNRSIQYDLIHAKFNIINYIG